MQKNNIVYLAKCKDFYFKSEPTLHHGETMRNLYTRSKEHYSALKCQCENNYMPKHIQNDNIGNVTNVNFSWRVIGLKPKLKE